MMPEDMVRRSFTGKILVKLNENRKTKKRI